MWYMPLIENGYIPDLVMRAGIRSQLAYDLQQRYAVQDAHTAKMSLIADLRNSDIAPFTREANQQHYEVRADFFSLVLGSRLKYSSGYWPAESTTLDESEEAMLLLTCERAGLRDGMSVLDLGCGWGSLCLWICEKYPGCQVMAVSNSHSQREYIQAKAESLGCQNLVVVTADMNEFTASPQAYDRIMSVEMFEHMRNYESLLARIAGWLRPDGRLFVHVFSHRLYTYIFDGANPTDWLAHYFFRGGVMPSNDLLLYFQRSFHLESHHVISGTHYARTLNAWLNRLDRHRDEALAVLESVYGQSDARRWLGRWRLFFMACAETFAFNSGREYGVSHYVFEKA